MRLIVSVVGNDPSGNRSIYSRIQADDYGPELVEDLINQAIADACASIGSEEALRSLQPQIEIWPVTDDLRPSFHFTASLLERIGRIGASLDFDPY